MAAETGHRGRGSKLERTLGLFDATAISVGATIGAGIFVVTGIAAGLAGSAMVVSMLVAASISAFTALSFAELSAWEPKEGGIYEYVFRLISPFTGFLVGWIWILSNIFGGAAVALGFAHYLKALWPAVPVGLTAAGLCLAFSALNFIGVQQSARVNTGLVVAKLAVLVFFVAFGAGHMSRANFAPFQPLRPGVLAGACFIFFAYTGFARVAMVAGEVKNPRRTVPEAILLSLAISTVVYILVGTTAIGLVGAGVLAGSSSPLTAAIKAAGSPLASSVVSAGALLATAGVLLTSILGVSRMAFAMALRKDMPAALGRLHPRFRTPALSIWIAGGIMAVLALLADLSKVVAISTFSLLFCYSFANLAALKLKSVARKYPRFLPAVGLTSCLFLLIYIFFVSRQAWLIGTAGLVAGALLKAIAGSRQKSGTPDGIPK